MQGTCRFACFCLQLRGCCQLPPLCCSFSVTKHPLHGTLKPSVCLQDQGQVHTSSKPLRLATKASHAPPLVRAEHKCWEKKCLLQKCVYLHQANHCSLQDRLGSGSFVPWIINMCPVLKAKEIKLLSSSLASKLRI